MSTQLAVQFRRYRHVVESVEWSTVVFCWTFHWFRFALVFFLACRWALVFIHDRVVVELVVPA
jgi:hypothetical protein